MKKSEYRILFVEVDQIKSEVFFEKAKEKIKSLSGSVKVFVTMSVGNDGSVVSLLRASLGSLKTFSITPDSTVLTKELRKMKNNFIVFGSDDDLREIERRLHKEPKAKTFLFSELCHGLTSFRRRKKACGAGYSSNRAQRNAIRGGLRQ